MKKYYLKKLKRIAVDALIYGCIAATLICTVQLLYNSTMPEAFGCAKLTFWQTLKLSVIIFIFKMSAKKSYER